MNDDCKLLQEENKRLQQQVEILRNQRDAYKEQLEALRDTISWKITRPLRNLLTNFQFIRDALLFCKSVLKNGIGKTCRMERERRWKNRNGFMMRLSDSERENQRNKSYLSQKKEYYFIVRVWSESSKQDLECTLSSIEWQSFVSADTFICVDEEKLKEVQTWERAKKNKLVAFGDIKKICSQLNQDAVVILCEAGDCFYEGSLFEIEKYLFNQSSDLFYMDDVCLDKQKGKYIDYCYKPDFSLHYLYSQNYIGHVIGIKAGILSMWLKNHIIPKDISFIYYLLLHMGTGQNIDHISQVLVGHSQKTIQANQREKKSCELFWSKRNTDITLQDGLVMGSRHLGFPIKDNPMISIIIPNCDHVDDLKKCINSIEEKTQYKNYEIIVVENNSQSKEVFDYYCMLERKENVKVITWDNQFNYSAINNFAVAVAQGEFLLLLNNDIEVISSSWITEMLMYAQMEEVGAVGAKLYFPDNTIQHAGVIIGVRGLAGHGHRNFAREADGYMQRLKVVQDYSAVTAACLMISKEKYQEINGFDETLAVDYNDVDLCLKLRQRGYYNVFTPYAELYHYESKSRGDNISPEKAKRVEKEYDYFVTKWYSYIKAGDPYYNKNLTLMEDDFSIETKRYDLL